MTDQERLLKATQKTARLRMQAARSRGKESEEDFRKARTHMLCSLGGAALHWMGPVDPYEFTPRDFEDLFEKKVVVKVAGGKLVNITIGKLVSHAWNHQQKQDKEKFGNLSDD